MPREQLIAGTFDGPSNIGFGKLPPDRAQHGQGQHAIANMAEPRDQDAGPVGPDGNLQIHFLFHSGKHRFEFVSFANNFAAETCCILARKDKPPNTEKVDVGQFGCWAGFHPAITDTTVEHALIDRSFANDIE